VLAGVYWASSPLEVSTRAAVKPV